MALDLDSLNQEQSEAVSHPGGALLVFAGAGSGKTRVITYRIARLIEKGVRPSNILAVTFTNKAAREMRERIEALVGERAKALWMGTFHSICGRILRESGRSIGIDRNFVIYDDSDQVALVRDILRKQHWDDKQITPRGVLSEISRAKEKMVEPERYANGAAGYFERAVAQVYPLYQEQLRKNNALDFDDMLGLTVRLLRERQDVRDKYQVRFEHILVDEFQDVNAVQYELIRLLGGRHGNVTIVGDDDQSIYAWRGADVSLIHKFAGEFPGAKTIKLERNYRSTKRILAAAHEVVRHNSLRADKTLWTDNADGALITITEAGTEQDEAQLIADTIIAKTRQDGRSYKQFAVLYRTNAQSRVLEEAFLMMRVPHVLIGGQRFYERKEIKDMVAYLRLVANPNDDTAMKRVINEPARGIGATTLSKMQEFAGDKPLWCAATDESFLQSLQKRTAASIRQFVNAVMSARVLDAPLGLSDESDGPISTEPILRQLLVSSGYMDSLRSERTEDANSRLDNLQELVNVAALHDSTADEPGLHSFLQEIALLTDQDELADQEEAGEGGKVTLMTAHTAKGLEFPVVFVVGLEEGVFPHSRSMGSDTEIEEERRLMYVAMTRAREELHITYAARRTTYGQANFNARSRFLSAIPPEITSALRDSSLPRTARSMTTVSPGPRNGPYRVDPPSGRQLISPDWKSPFEVGQQVRHTKFGVGVVIACIPTRGDCEVTVAFPGVIGVKKLMANIAKLEAVGA
jgi:DNA helicase-2/ATP-dependent DNA helicase PcrA